MNLIQENAPACSAFVREQIEKRLKELRYNCGLERLYLRWELYWENKQATAQLETPLAVARADKELARFIKEHRSVMAADWVGNEHGRLCWSAYLGGCPIDQHYCQKPEGHADAHGNEKGEWPRGVTNEHEWRRLLEKSEPARGQ